MDNILIPSFLAWNNHENHDKVWGYIRDDYEPIAKSLQSSYFSFVRTEKWFDDSATIVFWGRRGKKLTFKRFNKVYWWELYNKIQQEKLRNGYVEHVPLNKQGLEEGYCLKRMEALGEDFMKRYRSQSLMAVLKYKNT